MTSEEAVTALGALAQQSRLDLFRLLIRRGPDGVAAGDIADALDISAPTLSFHLAQLRHAGLIGMRREGRSLIYAANYQAMNELMGFLTEHCCSTTTCATPLQQKKTKER